jgi:hypothetical protein
MKRSSVLIACFLLVLPVAALAAAHAGSHGAASTAPAAAKASHGPVSNIGIKYGTYPNNVTFSTLTRSERVGVNCAVDRQCLLLQLRNQGLALQEKDGGKLTSEHRAELQAQLDLINARFH